MWDSTLGAASSGLLTVIACYNGTAGHFSILMLAPSLHHLGAALPPMLVLGIWKPGAAFAHASDEVVRSMPENTVQALKRLAQHRAIYPPAVIMLLWAFAPGWGTPLSVYLMKQVGLTEEIYGNVMAMMGVGTLLTTFTDSVLCLRLWLLGHR